MNQSKVITAQFSKRPNLGFIPCGGPGDQGFRVIIDGEFGAVYSVSGSTDLVGWAPLGTITNMFNLEQFTDPTATNRPFRFYRAQEELGR